MHLWKFGCPHCNNRFTGKEADLASWKQKHTCAANTRRLRQEPVEITTEEQDERFLRLDFRSPGWAGEAAFRCIFRAFWPEVSEGDIPDAHFKPGFLFSIPEIRATLETIEKRRYNAKTSSPRPRSPVWPASSQNLGTQLYPGVSPFPFTVPQGEPSMDSGYYAALEPSHRDTTPTLAPPFSIFPATQGQRSAELGCHAWASYLYDPSYAIAANPFSVSSAPEAQESTDSGYHTWGPSETDTEHNLVRRRAVDSQFPWEPYTDMDYLRGLELDSHHLPPYGTTPEKRPMEFAQKSVTDSVKKEESEDLLLGGTSSPSQQLKTPSSPSSKKPPPPEPHLLTKLRTLSVDEEWDSVLHQLDENIRWDTQLTRTTQGYSCWTCTADSASADSIPLTIANKAVVIPVRWHVPILPALSSPPDPHPRHISPLATLSEKTIDSILNTFDEALGFYLLINGDLQIIVENDYDIPYAACHKPNQFGGLKISYIFQSLTPTAAERSANLPTSARASLDTPRKLPKQQASARPSGQASGADTSDLAIGSPVRVVIDGSKSKDRFEGRLGLRTRSDQGTFVTIPTHLVTMSLAASKVPHEGPITACRDIKILAGNKALQASPSSLFTPVYRLPVCLRLMQPQLGSLAHCFDGEAKTFPDDFQHDISLVDVGRLPPATVSGLAPREPLEWLSPAEWDQLKLNTSKIYLLGDSKHEAKTIGLSPIPQYQVGDIPPSTQLPGI